MIRKTVALPLFQREIAQQIRSVDFVRFFEHMTVIWFPHADDVSLNRVKNVLRNCHTTEDAKAVSGSLVLTKRFIKKNKHFSALPGGFYFYAKSWYNDIAGGGE